MGYIVFKTTVEACTFFSVYFTVAASVLFNITKI